MNEKNSFSTTNNASISGIQELSLEEMLLISGGAYKASCGASCHGTLGSDKTSGSGEEV